MKIRLFLFLLAAVCFSGFCTETYAGIKDEHPTFTLVNHYGKDLIVWVNTGVQYVPSFSKTQVLHNGEEMTSEVLASGSECGIDNDAPVAIGAAPVNPIGLLYSSAFFGVGVTCDDPSIIQVHGYMGTGDISYNYTPYSSQAKLVICQKKDYPCM